MGIGSESSRASLPSRQQPAPRPSTAAKLSGGSGTTPQQDALLSMREEWMQAKKSEQAAEHKLRQMAAQLARTEEAAKRILTRTDPSARGGTAAALLEAERQLVSLRAEHAEQSAQLAVARRQAADHKRQAADLKKRLEAATADQRRLALQLGRLQAGGGAAGAFRRPLAPPAPAAGCLPPAPYPGNGSHVECTTTGSTGHGGMKSAAAGEGPAGEEAGMCGEEAALAKAAQRFAQQQEQLAAALDRGRQLEEQLRQREQTVQQQARQLAALHAQHAQHAAASGLSGHGSTRPMAGASASPRFPLAAATQPCSCPQHLADTGSDGGGCVTGCAEAAEGCEVQALRVKYLKSKSAVESLAASHTRLLRQLESTRAQAAAADAQHQAQLLQLQSGGRARQQGPEQGGGGGGGASQLLQLRQQLAVACHRAERLQIKLDASQSRLAIYEGHAAAAHPHQADGAQQSWGQPHVPPPPQEQQEAVPGSRGGVLWGCPTQEGHEGPPFGWQGTQQRAVGDAAGGDAEEGRSLQLPVARPAGQQGAHAHCQQQQRLQQQRECVDVAGLPPHQTIIELHLHGAELQPELLLLAGGAAGGAPPLPPFSFLTADFFDCSTQLTPLAQGCRPLYNTTLQFVVGCGPALAAHLATGSVRVELHRCQPGADGGLGADYSTAASADIPLASLLRGTGGPAEEPRTYQQVSLLSAQGGARCGTLRYALTALRPVVCQPGASLALTPPTQQRPEQGSWECAGGGGGGTQPRAPPAQQRPRGGTEGVAAPMRAGSPALSCMVLRVDVVGCRDLLPADGSPADPATMQPRVSLLLLPGAGGASGNNRDAAQPPWPLPDSRCVFETARAAGRQPRWTSECASFAVDGRMAAQGECRLQAVVFDDAVPGGRSPDESVIGVALIHLTPPAAPAPGATALHPLLHPVSGRHAGLLLLGWAWEE